MAVVLVGNQAGLLLVELVLRSALRQGNGLLPPERPSHLRPTRTRRRVARVWRVASRG